MKLLQGLRTPVMVLAVFLAAIGVDFGTFSLFASLPAAQPVSRCALRGVKHTVFFFSSF